MYLSVFYERIVLYYWNAINFIKTLSIISVNEVLGTLLQGIRDGQTKA